NRVLIRHEGICVAVNRNRRRHASTYVAQGRRRFGDLRAVRLIAKPLHGIRPALGKWLLVRAVEKICNIRDAEEIDDRRHFRLLWRLTEAIEAIARTQHAGRQREMSTGG